MYSAHTIGNRSSLEARFARATRHSRFVRVLRVSIPTAVAAALTGIVLLTLFNPFRVAANVTTDTDNLVMSGTKITMEAPRMTGFSADLRPYEIWGDTAVQDTADPDNIALTEPRAKLTMEDGSIMNVESRTGRFNNKTKLLDLYKEVYVQTSSGYDARLNHAQIDTAASAVATDDGVNVKFDSGRVKADRLRMTNRGEVVRFEGNVVMDLDRIEPGAAQGKADPDATEPVSEKPALRGSESPRPVGKPRSLTGNNISAK